MWFYSESGLLHIYVRLRQHDTVGWNGSNGGYDYWLSFDVHLKLDFNINKIIMKSVS